MAGAGEEQCRDSNSRLGMVAGGQAMKDLINQETGIHSKTVEGFTQSYGISIFSLWKASSGYIMENLLETDRQEAGRRGGRLLQSSR